MVFVKSVTMLNACLSHAKGCYQQAILLGRQRLSGADLRGNAKSYSGRYRRSSQNLIKRCKGAGLLIKEVKGPNNRRDLVIG